MQRPVGESPDGQGAAARAPRATVPRVDVHQIDAGAAHRRLPHRRRRSGADRRRACPPYAAVVRHAMRTDPARRRSRCALRAAVQVVDVQVLRRLVAERLEAAAVETVHAPVGADPEHAAPIAQQDSGSQALQARVAGIGLHGDGALRAGGRHRQHADKQQHCRDPPAPRAMPAPSAETRTVRLYRFGHCMHVPLFTPAHPGRPDGRPEALCPMPGGNAYSALLPSDHDLRQVTRTPMSEKIGGFVPSALAAK